MANITECWPNASEIDTICSSQRKYIGLIRRETGSTLKVCIATLYCCTMVIVLSPDFQDLVWIPKLALSGLVGQTDGITELNYGGSQMIFGKCQGLVKVVDMTAIQVFQALMITNTLML